VLAEPASPTSTRTCVESENRSPLESQDYTRCDAGQCLLDGSQRVEPSQQCRIPPPSWRPGWTRNVIDLLKRLSRGLHVRLGVKERRVEVCVSQPTLDHGRVDTGSYRLNRSRVPESVRRDALLAEVRMQSLGSGPCWRSGSRIPQAPSAWPERLVKVGSSGPRGLRLGSSPMRPAVSVQSGQMRSLRPFSMKRT
jgi:hypothetical protein